MRKEVNHLIKRTEKRWLSQQGALKTIFLFLELPPGALRIDKSGMLTMYVEIVSKYIKQTTVKCKAPWKGHLAGLGSPHSCSLDPRAAAPSSILWDPFSLLFLGKSPNEASKAVYLYLFNAQRKISKLRLKNALRNGLCPIIK